MHLQCLGSSGALKLIYYFAKGFKRCIVNDKATYKIIIGHSYTVLRQHIYKNVKPMRSFFLRGDRKWGRTGLEKLCGLVPILENGLEFKVWTDECRFVHPVDGSYQYCSMWSICKVFYVCPQSKYICIIYRLNMFGFLRKYEIIMSDIYRHHLNNI